MHPAGHKRRMPTQHKRTTRPVITALVLTSPLSALPKIEPAGWISGKGV